MEVTRKSEIEYSLCFSARGAHFDPDAFFQKIESKGGVGVPKSKGLKYWHSDEVEITYSSSIHISDFLLPHLIKYDKILELARNMGAEEIVYSIGYYAKQECLKGLHVSEDLISLLNRRKVTLDFDIVNA